MPHSVRWEFLLPCLLLFLVSNGEGWEVCSNYFSSTFLFAMEFAWCILNLLSARVKKTSRSVPTTKFFCLQTQGFCEVRNCCNATSCLLKHSGSVLLFQGAGNSRVTPDTIVRDWGEHNCCVGKLQEKEILRRFLKNARYFIKAWRNPWTLGSYIVLPPSLLLLGKKSVFSKARRLLL